ncbi:hypothetical protein [Mycobacterium malmoense]|uniref:hypothetical protein n=1 Tax=Mycobacterium malmoense TaxID=1780 RepID=UPI0008F9488C|nr:hypothetical protein [Mycobacterium malmoense]OIN80853.1 hypothetical protein BMG05_10995 [Mycobacterium malmoense]
MLSPFVDDLTERAAKSLVAAWPTMLFTDWVASDYTSVPWLHATVAATGVTLISVGMSLISRHYGTRGTASMIPNVRYDR